jgi:hypothetical protein
MDDEPRRKLETTAHEGARRSGTGLMTDKNIIPLRPRPSRERGDSAHGAPVDGTEVPERASAAGRRARSSARPSSRIDARESPRNEAPAGDVTAETPAATAFDAAVPVHVCPDMRGNLVRERLNAAARPILCAFARRRGVLTRRLQAVIDGPRPLVDPPVVRQLGGALHSEAMRDAIASNADPALVPLKVRAGLATMLAQALSGPPPAAMKEAFPDWNKPLAPLGRRLEFWQARDAAAWLRRFPPQDCLLHPIATWDATTAALWLNDREPILPDLSCEGEPDSTLVAFEPSNPWKPSLEVLHTLDELEHEALAYRVFLERMRRDVMPFYVSERRVDIQKAIELVTFGYQTLAEARRAVGIHDRRRIGHFDRVFGENREWICDLCYRIIAAYAWPHGFAEPELRSDFPDLNEAPQ